MYFFTMYIGPTTSSDTKCIKFSDFPVNKHGRTSAGSIGEENKAEMTLEYSDFHVFTAIIAICMGLLAAHFMPMSLLPPARFLKTAGGIVLVFVAASADVLLYISVAIKASFLKLGMCNICKNNIAKMFLDFFTSSPFLKTAGGILFCVLSPSLPSPRMFCLISRLQLKLAFWNLACAIYAKTVLLKSF